jgi:RNA polymerase-binding protein DksA
METSTYTTPITDGRVSPFNDEELEHFRQIILKKRLEAIEEIDIMRRQIEEAKEHAEDDTAYSFHMADAGTDAMEREKLYLMIARQQKFVGYLERALQRVENKSYGICKITGQPIPKGRLEAVPHTEVSIEAKREQNK